MGVNLSYPELSHFVEVVNSIHGGEHRVFTIEYSTQRREHLLRAHGSVGFAYYVRNGKRITFQVLPKPFRRDPNERRSVQFFLQLLNLARGMEFGRSELSLLAEEYSRSGNIDELFKSMYVLLLARALLEGNYLEYGVVSESSKIVRGRILMSRLARKPPWNPEVPVEYSVMREDNPLNRVLKGALELVVRTSRWKSTRKLGGLLMSAFLEVSSPRPGDSSRVTFNHLNERFRTVFHLAETILSGFSGRGFTARVLPGIFISMDSLFESLLYHTMKSAIGREAEVRFQEALPHVIRNAREYELRRRALFMMGRPLPDILVKSEEGSCVVDAKYRDLYVYLHHKKRGQRKLVRNSGELYQAYTYAKLAGGNVILVYPRLEGRYNYWLPDLFSAEDGDAVEFFDGTKLAILGYELSRVGNGVEITRGGVSLSEELADGLRDFLLRFCGEV
jgi:5-methylcytosine-specific restriction enzyme subunit McrC